MKLESHRKIKGEFNIASKTIHDISSVVICAVNRMSYNSFHVNDITYYMFIADQYNVFFIDRGNLAACLYQLYSTKKLWWDTSEGN